MKKLLLLTFLLFSIAISSYGQSAVVNNSRAYMTVKQALTFAKYEKFFSISVDVDIMNAYGKKTYIYIYFYDENGNDLKDQNNKFCATDGHICLTKEIIPYNNNCKFSDYILTMPTSELHISKNGVTDLKYKVAVLCNDQWIHSSTHINDFTYEYILEKCNNCNDGKCRHCNGTGRNGQWKCLACTSTFGAMAGRCSNCLGDFKGYILKSKYVTGKSYIEGVDIGKVFEDDVYASPTPAPTPSPTPNNPTGGTTKKERICNVCNGAGTVVRSISTSGFGLPKNEVKVKCPTCGVMYLPSIGHSHIPCSNCGRTGKVRY